MDYLLNEMDLPLANSREELSIISENQFRPIFDVEKFLVRQTMERDKGIDFEVELKLKGRHTNFKFVVQLKATDSEKANKDGTISLQVDTSNINYLLNNPMPAFYVLYLKKTNTFYYENLNEFAKSLYDKNANWNSQASHVLKFSKKFDSSITEDMFRVTYEKGKLQRILNEETALRTSLINPGDKILLGHDLSVTSDAEIRSNIQNYGFSLIGEGKWKEVISLHKKASGNVAITAKYNLVLGIAHYYNGNMVDSISFFNTASRLKSELDNDLQNHLLYFESIAKYSIGLINEEVYSNKLKKLENTDTVGLYIKIDQAKIRYIDSFLTNSNIGYINYIKEINEIINNPKAGNNIKLNAKCDLIFYDGQKNNIDYVKTVVHLNQLEDEIGPKLELRLKAVNDFMSSHERWYNNLTQLLSEATKLNNLFVYHHAILNEAKIDYDFNVYTDTVSITKEIPGQKEIEKTDKRERFEKTLVRVDLALKYFQNIGHVENILAAFFIKYEISDYLDHSETSENVLNEMENIIENYDLIEFKRKFSILKKDGATHKTFKIQMENVMKNAKIRMEKYKDFEKEMKEMDEKEKESKSHSSTDTFEIHLFPIGYFRFPKKDIELVYEILNVSKDARKNFDSVFKTAIPIANIYYSEILEEGLINGHLANHGDSFSNFYKVRKAFFDNKFYRLN